MRAGHQPVGRERHHYLNRVPIRQTHDRWLDMSTARTAETLLALHHALEDPSMAEGVAAYSSDRLQEAPKRIEGI